MCTDKSHDHHVSNIVAKGKAAGLHKMNDTTEMQRVAQEIRESIKMPENPIPQVRPPTFPAMSRDDAPVEFNRGNPPRRPGQS